MLWRTVAFCFTKSAIDLASILKTQSQLPEKANTTLVIGSSVIDEESKTPEEQLKSLPTQDEILQLPSFDLNEMPDIVTALKDSQPDDLLIIPVLDADNQILPEVLSELKVRVPRTVDFP